MESLVEQDLNIKGLFDTDLEKLEPKEVKALKYIAQRAYDGDMFDATEIDEVLENCVLTELINKRLVIKTGTNFAKRSLNNGQKCRKPVFMRASGICFIKWLWFGSICGESNEVISFEKVNKKERRYKLCCQQEKKH